MKDVYIVVYSAKYGISAQAYSSETLAIRALKEVQKFDEFDPDCEVVEILQSSVIGVM